MKKTILLTLLLSNFVYGEIHKEAQVCNESGQICFFWWPKLPSVEGWEQDVRHSYHYRMNTQAPTAFTFANAEAVIYARADLKDDVTGKKSLKEFIEFSQNQFTSAAPSKTKISKIGEFKSKGKPVFYSYSFIPESQGNFEHVSYAEEIDKDGDDYFIILVISSRSKEELEKRVYDYYKFIENYK